MASAKKATPTGKSFVIEIGLDGNVAPRYDGTYPYLMSLVKVESWEAQSGDPWWFTNLNSHDQIVFRACDYTDYSGFPKKYQNNLSVKGLFVQFLDTKDAKSVSRCVSHGVICSGQYYWPVGSSKSLVVPGKSGWRFVDYAPEIGPFPDKPYAFTAGKHRALLRASVIATFQTAKGDEQLRWFTHDPEIFVGEGSGMEPPSRRRQKGKLSGRA